MVINGKGFVGIGLIIPLPILHIAIEATDKAGDPKIVTLVLDTSHVNTGIQGPEPTRTIYPGFAGEIHSAEGVNNISVTDINTPALPITLGGFVIIGMSGETPNIHINM